MLPPDLPAALPPEALRASFSGADFDFATTEALAPLGGWLGQDRGIGVVRMAAAMKEGDFNAFVMGTPGSGRHRIAKAILEDAASTRPCPGDWVYVNNFDTPHKPVAIALPPGDAERLRKAMEALIDELAADIPALFESEDYQTRRRAIEERFSSAHEEAMSAVFDEARARKVAILRTPMGFTFAGMHGDEAMTKEQYEALSDADRAALDAAMKETQENLSEVLRALRADLDHIKLTGSGSYTLLDGDFDTTFKARLSPELESVDRACRVSKRLTAIDWPLDCSGNIDGEPGKWCKVDTAAIVKDLSVNEAQRKIEKKAGKLLDKLFN